MKIQNNILNKIALGSILAAAMAIATSLPTQLRAADTATARGGATKLLEFGQIKTQADAEALKPNDAMAMVCGKCKTVTVTHVTQDSKHLTKMVPGEKHLCTGCKSTIEVVGVGKGKHDEVKHVCKTCGSESAFCCATKPGSGATKGMEGEKK